jgi:protein-disulfide isomerase
MAWRKSNAAGIIMSLVLIAVALGISALLRITDSGGKDKPDPTEAADTAGAKPGSAVPVATEQGLVVGPEGAPNTVTIYEDFLCPYCEMFETATRDGLRKLAADGTVRVEYRPFNLLSPKLGDYSYRAAAAYAVVLDRSGPEAALKFHDLLYENQPPESGPFPSDDDLIARALQAGAADADVRAPIQNGEGDSRVDSMTAEAAAAGVRGTPTILLNGQEFRDGKTMGEMVDSLIAKLSGDAT